MNQNPNPYPYPYHQAPSQPIRDAPSYPTLPPQPVQSSPYQSFPYSQLPTPPAQRYPTFEESYPQPRPYQQNPPASNLSYPQYPVVQQYQAVPNAQPVFAPNPNGYVPPSQMSANSSVPNQDHVVASYQYQQVQEPQNLNEVNKVETKIKSGFCCYSFLLYLGLIVSIVGVVMSLVHIRSFKYRLAPKIFAIIMIFVFIFAIRAKKRMNSKGQFRIFAIFCLTTIAQLAISIISVIAIIRRTKETFYEHHGPHRRGHGHDGVAIQIGLVCLVVVLPFIFNIIFIHSSRALTKLMKERERLLGNSAVIQV